MLQLPICLAAARSGLKTTADSLAPAFANRVITKLSEKRRSCGGPVEAALFAYKTLSVSVPAFIVTG